MCGPSRSSRRTLHATEPLLTPTGGEAKASFLNGFLVHLLASEDARKDVSPFLGREGFSFETDPQKEVDGRLFVSLQPPLRQKPGILTLKPNVGRDP